MFYFEERLILPDTAPKRQLAVEHTVAYGNHFLVRLAHTRNDPNDKLNVRTIGLPVLTRNRASACPAAESWRIFPCLHTVRSCTRAG